MKNLKNKKDVAIGDHRGSIAQKHNFFAKMEDAEKINTPIEYTGTQYQLYYCHACGGQITGSFHRVVHEEICCLKRGAPKKVKKYRVKTIRLRYFHPACFPQVLDHVSEYRALFA